MDGVAALWPEVHELADKPICNVPRRIASEALTKGIRVRTVKQGI